METKNITETMLLKSSKLGKNLNTGAISASIIIITAGVTAFIYMNNNELATAVNMLIMLVGAAAIILGIINLIRNTKKIVYVPTKSRIEVKEIHFDGLARKKIVESLENKDFDFKGIKRRHGGSIRLDLLRSKDGTLTAAQLFEFVPYTYQAITDVYSFEKREGEDLWQNAGA